MRVAFYKRMGLALAAAAVLFTASSRADLTWTSDGGWKFEGGVLGPLLGEQGASASALESMNKAKAAQEAGSYWSALSLYDEVIDNYPSSVFAPEALYQKGLIYTARNEFQKAYDSFERVISRYPDYPNFQTVIGREYKVASLIQGGARPYLWGWLPWFKDISKADDFFEGVVKNAPYSEYAPLALMNIAQIANERTDEPDKAIDALDRVINNYPTSALAPDAYLEMADVYSDLVIGAAYDQGSTRQAIRYLRDYLYLYPTSAQAPGAQEKLDDMTDVYARSQLLLGDFYYYYRNSNRAALIFYHQAKTLASSTDVPAAQEAQAQIDKINAGEAPPKTPYDWVFGRYKSPSQRTADEQGRIDKLAAEAFASHSTDSFAEKPGPETVETISGNETPAPESTESFPTPPPGPSAPPPVSTTPPVVPIPNTPPPTPSQGSPLLK